MQYTQAKQNTAVRWVKKELEQSLNETGSVLSSFIESPEDMTHLQQSRKLLREILGVLRMVDVQGGVLLVEELLAVLEVLAEGRLRNREEALEVVMRGVVQLPDYLDYLQRGNPDVPIVLLPLLNDLRTCRDSSLYSEQLLSLPDLETDAQSLAALPVLREDISLSAKALRPLLQQALLGWYRNHNTDRNLLKIAAIFHRLTAAATLPQVRRLCWISQAAAEALQAHALESSVTIKMLFGKLDRQIKRLIELGEKRFAAQVPSDLVRNMLFYVASADSGNSTVNSVKEVYGLASMFPPGSLEMARASLHGSNASMYQTLSGVLLEDIAAIKEQLEVYVMAENSDVERLESVVPQLEQLGDTLGMLGLAKRKNWMQTESRLLDVALKNEKHLPREQIEGIAQGLMNAEFEIEGLGSDPVIHDVSEGDGLADLPEHEYQKILSAVIRESLVVLSRCKEVVLSYVQNPQDQQLLHSLPLLFAELRGAMLMLPMASVMPLLEGLDQYVAHLGNTAKVPDDEALAQLADVLVSIEFYLESIEAGKGDHQNILDQGQQSLSALLAAVPPQETAELLAADFSPSESRGDSLNPIEAESTLEVDSAESQPEEELSLIAETGEIDLSQIEGLLEEETEASVSLENSLAEQVVAFDTGGSDEGESAELPEPDFRTVEELAAAEVDDSLAEDRDPALDESDPFPGLQVLPEEFDPEIMEIFREEAGEEIDRIRETLPQWSADPANHDALSVLRRAFHTLKGSGRLVGAEVLGEFAWAHEKMLNRVLDNTLPANTAVTHAIATASSILPDLVAALETGARPGLAVASQMRRVEMLAASNASDYHSDDTLMIASQLIAPDVIEAALTGMPEQHPELSSEERQMQEDAELFAVFKAESEDHLKTLEEYLTRWREHPGTERPEHELYRALHTLNGSARTAEVSEIYEPAAAAERYVKHCAEADLVFSQDFPELLYELVGHVRKVLGEIELGESLDSADVMLPRLRELAEESKQQLEEKLLAAPEPEADEEALLSEPSFIQTSALAGMAVELENELEEAINAMDEAMDQTGLEPVMDVEDSVAEWLPDSNASAEAEMLVGSETDFETGIAPEESAAAEMSAGTEEIELPSLTSESSVIEPVSEAEVVAAEAAEAEQIRVIDAEIPVEQVPAVEEHEVTAEADFEEEHDEELAEIFLEEAGEILDASENAFAIWHEEPGDLLPVKELQRHLHTLKGGARMAGYRHIGDLSHMLESLFISVVETRQDADESLFRILHQAFDELHSMVQASRNKEPSRAAAGVMTALQDWLDGKREQPAAEQIREDAEEYESVSADVSADAWDQTTATLEEYSKPMVAEAEPEAAIDTVAKTVPEIVFTPTARFEAAPVLGRTEQHAAGGVQESVRVRSDLLDELVNQAGEINIFHSRVEEQVTGFSNNLQELEQTITRLARQVRSLEGEAEAQVLAHWQRDEPIDFESTLGGLDFDPLELDRYSKIQQLSRGLSESINDLLSIQGLMGEMVRDTETLMVQQTRLSTDLQDGLMRTRMIPFATLLPRLRRVVRQVSNELDKQVEIRIVGESSEMDRKLLESMTVPLEHMLRNAVAHGIESADLRAERGKDRAGHILVQVKREGNEVVILVEDDGGGIPVDAIRDKALEKGLIQAVDELNDEEVMQLILQSGFSTADNVSQVAGRGVGMDIVNTEIKQLNGSLTISSVPGKGTRFRIVLPFTLAINRAMLITVEDEHFAIPMGSVEGVVRLTAKEAREKLADESTTIEYAGQQYPLRSLSALLLQRAPDIDLAQAQWPVLLLRAGEHRIGLLINAIEGNREVVIKSLGPLLSKLASISGATILGDGKVVLVLDVPGLLRSSAAGVIRPLKKAEAPRVRQPLIMVVDDSITIRKVTARMLERHHYQVVTAKDGIDAITRLQEVKPDLMLLDIEMPRMDGYELAGHIRNQKDIKHLPIIMITSRTGQKHKDRAMALGVNRYLGKPYQENELMENITSLLRESQEA